MRSEVEHQLRNQLAIILGYANLLLEEMRPDHPNLRDVQDIREAAEGAIALLRVPPSS